MQNIPTKRYPGREKARIFNLLGGLAYRANNLDMARTLLHRAIKIDPTNSEFYNNLGVVYSAGHRLRKATLAFQNAMTHQPDNIESCRNLGLTLYRRGRIPEATYIFKRAISIDPEDAESHLNLGNCHQISGHQSKARLAYLTAIQFQPDYTEAYLNLGNLYYREGDTAKSIKLYRKATEMDPRSTRAFHNLALALKAIGNTQASIKAFETAARLDHKNMSARHMLAALTGKTTDRAPAQYVRKLFNSYANGFERHLMDKLQYRMPSLLNRLVAQLSQKQVVFDKALDLGCGTGLAGEIIRPVVKELYGVDLSPAMIDIAAAKDIYDHLVIDDIPKFLLKHRRQFDMIIALDALVYFGDLRSVFRRIRHRLRKGGFFILSTETSAKKSYALRSSGRYAHSKSYIRSLARQNGLKPHITKSTVVRKESGRWIRGELYILIGT